MQASDSSGDFGGGSAPVRSCMNDRRSTLSARCAVSSFCTHRCFEWNQAPLLRVGPPRAIIGTSPNSPRLPPVTLNDQPRSQPRFGLRSEEHTSELQSLAYLVCRLLLEKKKSHTDTPTSPLSSA